MAIGTALAAISTAATVVGTVGSTVMGLQGAAAAQDAEDARKKQMNLDAMRTRRQAMREALRDRAISQARATAQGASEGSGVAGGQAEIMGNFGNTFMQTNQNQQIGSQIFSANARQAQAQTIGSAFSGLSSLAGSLMKAAPTINRVGNYVTGNDPYNQVYTSPNG